MKDYVAVYMLDLDAEKAVAWPTEPFSRFFSGDDLDHAYEQAVDATEAGERLVCVADGPTRLWVRA